MTKPDNPPSPNRPITNREIREWAERLLEALFGIKAELQTSGDLAELTVRIRAQTSAFAQVLAHSTVISGAPSPLTTNRRRNTMSAELDALTQAVTELEEVGASVLQLIDNIAAALDAAIAANDPAALVALKDRLIAQKQALADAVVAHTPAA